MFVRYVLADDTYTYKQTLGPNELSRTYGFRDVGTGAFKAELTSSKPMKLELKNKSGTTLAASSYATAPTISTTLAQAGNYDLIVSGRAADITATTNYTLKITNKYIAAAKRAQFPDGVNSFPSASNTGWQHTGVTLTASGSITASKEGQVIDGKDINGCVQVTAKNVVIKRSRIRCGSFHGVYVKSGNVTIEDTEIIGTNNDCGQAVAFANYKLKRVNIHGCADGLKSNTNVVVEDSYIHDQRKGPGTHNDAVQSTGGSNVVFRRNRIDGPYQASTSAFIINTANAKIDNWLIENNYISGGGYMIYMTDKGRGYGAPTNMTIRNNTFEAFSMTYSWVTYDGNPTFSGNKWHTGQLVKSGEKRGPGN